MSPQLTKDAEKLICIMYKTYLERRKNGINKSEAVCFNDAEEINTLVPQWSIDDVNYVCLELGRANFLTFFLTDGCFCVACQLTDEAIIYMENCFKKGLQEVIDFIAKLIP